MGCVRGVGGYTEAKVGEVAWSHQMPLESSGLLRCGHWDMGPTQRQDSKRDPHSVRAARETHTQSCWPIRGPRQEELTHLQKKTGGSGRGECG